MRRRDGRRGRRARALVALVVACVARVAPARAYPDKVACDRTVNGVDVMTASTIMGATPAVATDVIATGDATYAPGRAISVTLTVPSTAEFAHASAGALTTASNNFVAKACATTALQYANAGAAGTHALTWTAPTDLTALPTVEISVGYASERAQVTRQKVTLTRAAAAPCAANHRVANGACVACAAGSTRAAGDDPTAGDTACAATRCAVNERVVSHACVACGAYDSNAAGDDATGGDTTCDGLSAAATSSTRALVAALAGALALAA